jgi:hypothetical protein
MIIEAPLRADIIRVFSIAREAGNGDTVMVDTEYCSLADIEASRARFGMHPGATFKARSEL